MQRTRHNAFEDFYRSHRYPVAQALAITLRDAALGEEAADEAMARAFERWSKVRQTQNQPGWVYRVGLNWALDQIRKSTRARRLRPANGMAAADAANLEVGFAVEGLPYDHRAVVVLRHYLDWTVKEIAASLEIPEGTVKSRLNRAHSALSAALEEQR